MVVDDKLLLECAEKMIQSAIKVEVELFIIGHLKLPVMPMMEWKSKIRIIHGAGYDFHRNVYIWWKDPFLEICKIKLRRGENGLVLDTEKRYGKDC